MIFTLLESSQGLDLILKWYYANFVIHLQIIQKQFSCKYSSAFWDKVPLWLKEGNEVKSSLSFIDIKYGNFEEDGKKVSWLTIYFC